MKTKKLGFSEEDKIEMKKLREKLASIEMDDEDLSKIYVGGCGAFCQITCSYYCESGCERTCSTSCTGTCTYRFLIGGDCGCDYLRQSYPM